MTKIVVRFQEPGFHRWPNAKGDRAYLGQKHRHLFHVQVTTKVEHDDREIEFHDLLDWSRRRFVDMGVEGDFGGQSCEMLARQLAVILSVEYEREFEVQVFEDGECGAVVTVGP